MPFDNLSGHTEDTYLADGLQEEILNALARVRELNVISRTSVMEFRGKTRNIREIGQRLNVGSVLEGSIRRDGNTLRLTVQLIDVRDDRHILATNYDRDLAAHP
jgi:adenylate cyclase